MSRQSREQALNLYLRARDPRLLEQLGIPVPRRRESRWAAETVFLHTRIAAVLDIPQLYVSRNKSDYAKGRRLGGPGFGYQPLFSAIDQLVRAGQIEERRMQAGLASKWRSTIRAAPGSVTTVPDCRYLEGDTIQLRVNGQPVAPPDNELVRRLRRDMAAINEGVGSAEIDVVCDHAVRQGSVMKLEDRDVWLFRKWHYRVFTDDLQSHGRLYGPFWLHQMRKEQRKFITIGGARTVEKDFEQLHPSILYDRAGLKLESDAYTLDGWARPAVKRAFNAVINSKSHSAAIGAVQRSLYCDRATAARLVNEVKKRHPGIASAFHSEAWRPLQKIDSDITCAVMLDLLGRGIVPLPIHDAYRVAEQHEGVLLEAMNRAKFEVVRRADLCL